MKENNLVYCAQIMGGKNSNEKKKNSVVVFCSIILSFFLQYTHVYTIQYDIRRVRCNAYIYILSDHERMNTGMNRSWKEENEK